MERKIYSQLLKWKNKETRKPLIVEGARQVGKTWLMKEFGRKEYDNAVYVNCDRNNVVRRLFESDNDTGRIIRNLSALFETEITPTKTLIILDEIQEIPAALNSLKYFCENAPEYHIVAAGSLLGLQVHEGSGFPVGKVDRLRLGAMTFSEFLLAMGNRQLADMLAGRQWKDVDVLSAKFTELLRQYYFTGGMPEVVGTYQSGDVAETRKVQKRILSDYADDFSKHVSPQMIQRVQLVWNSIPSQLARENKKFRYGEIKAGARSKDFETAIGWLIGAGLVHQSVKVSKIAVPLKFYEAPGFFKLFLNDLGLLGALADAPVSQILVEKNIFAEYKGAFAEQYVAQQYLCACWNNGFDPVLRYWSNDNSTSEIDFVVQNEGEVFPVEVKAERNLKSKSLSSFLAGNPGIHAIRFSLSGYEEQDRIANVPLYAAENYFEGVLNNL